MRLPGRTAYWRSVWVVSAVLMIGLSLGCRPTVETGTVPASDLPAESSDGGYGGCPNHPGRTLLPPRPGEPEFRNQSNGALVPDTIVTTIAGDLHVDYDTTMRSFFDVPEFHDCQRLLTLTRQYGPVAGIFSFDASHPPFTAMDFGQPGGAAVALIYNFTDHNPVFPTPAGLAAQPPASGSKDTWGKRSCVYLSQVGADDWKARVWQTTLAGCPNILPLNVPTLPMNVSRSTPSANESDYPRAARWDFDSIGNVQYMGVRCLAGWCEIGPASSGFQSSPVLASIGDKYHTIKGWYDEQFLAAASPTGVGLVPSNMFGTLAPEIDLSQLTPADYSCDPGSAQMSDPHRGQAILSALASPRHCLPTPLTYTSPDDSTGFWRRVASIQIRNANAKYKEKFRLDKNGNSFVYLRYNPAVTANPWQMRYGQEKREGRVLNALRTDHAGQMANGYLIVVPGTVRWKWVLKDEYTWNACSQGCCSGIDW